MVCHSVNLPIAALTAASCTVGITNAMTVVPLLLMAAVNYRMSEKWILNAGGVIDLGDTGNIGERIGITRVGESLLVRVGMNVDHSRDNIGAFFAVEPRFLSGRLAATGGVPIPPTGALGLE